jgi:large subunit ribosomal protein L1
LVQVDKKDIENTLKAIRENSKKRNFKQSIDLIINFKDLDLKKPDQQLDLFVQLHFSRGLPVKVAAFVGPELLTQAREVCDMAISIDEFDKYKDKKAAKKLAEGFDFFLAQATIMPKIAQVFGRVLGPRSKMPNPNAGAVVPPNANLKPVYEKFQKTIRISVKKDPLFQCLIGREDSKDEEIIDNLMTIYNAIIQHVPNEKHNIKSMYLKLSMGPAVRIGDKLAAEATVEKKKKAKAAKEAKPETAKQAAKKEKAAKPAKAVKEAKAPKEKSESSTPEAEPVEESE